MRAASEDRDDHKLTRSGSSAPGLSLHIKSRVHIIHILLVQLFPQELDGLAEALEVDDLPLPQEFDRIIHIRVIR